MKILILDDDGRRHIDFSIRYSGHDVTHTFGYHEFVDYLSQVRWDLIHLDYDLDLLQPGDFKEDGKPYTGLDDAQRAVDSKVHPVHVIVHSRNDWGAIQIHRLLVSSGIDAIKIPFNYNETIERGRQT